jgi:hypothetical protein
MEPNRNPNTPPLARVNAELFTWSGTKTGVADLSDLGIDLGEVFFIENPMTKKAVLFRRKRTLYSQDHEREIIAWRYADTEGLGLTVDILND